MKINVVLAARWSAEHAGPPNPAATITMTQIRRLVPLETSPVPIYGSSQYDVYCWAKAGFLMLDLLFASSLIYCCIASNHAAWSESEQSQDDIESTRIKMNQFGVKFFPCLEDDAQTTTGFDRPNYMSHTYVSAAVVNPLLPAGGATMGLWVTDLTPPTINYVSAESISSDTIQMTLQLDEPGTIWLLGRTEMVRNHLQAYGKEEKYCMFCAFKKEWILVLTNRVAEDVLQSGRLSYQPSKSGPLSTWSLSNVVTAGMWVWVSTTWPPLIVDMFWWPHADPAFEFIKGPYSFCLELLGVQLPRWIPRSISSIARRAKSRPG